MVRIEHYGIEPDFVTREIDGRRLTHRGGYRPRGSYGRARAWRPRQHVLRTSGVLRRSACRDRNDRKRWLAARSTTIGEHFEKRARSWQKKWPLVGDIRGIGGMCAIELVRNRETREPADSETKEIAHYCYEHGLITITAGTYNNVMRIFVPLVITDEQFNEGLDVIEAALASVAERKQAALSHA